MDNFINTIDLLGDEVVAKSIIEKTIIEFNDDLLTAVKDRAFYQCPELTSVNLPNVTLGKAEEAFYYCKKLKNVNLPNITELSGTFGECSALTSVNVPKLKKIGGSTFQYCTALTSIDLPNVTGIGYSVFWDCTKLTSIILRSETMCTLSSTNSFTRTPFASDGTGGTVYVPQALITQYQSATNWSSLYAGGKCNFVAIEGSEYE